MKTPSSELFELIKSLSNGEIKGFVAQSYNLKLEEEPEYIALFKAYAASKELNEEQLQKKLKLKNFKRVKHYLQQNILNYLATQEGNSIEKEVMNMISVGNLLMDRSLFAQANSIFEKAKKKAQYYELNYHLLIIEEKLFHVNSHLNNKLFVDSVLDGSKAKEFKHTLNAIKIEEELHVSLLKRWRFYQQHGTILREKKISDQLIHILEPYVIKGEDYPITINSKHNYYITAAFYYQEKNQIAKAIECLEKSVQLAEQHHREMVGVIPPLLASLNNLVFIYAKYNKLTELRLTLDKVHDNLPAKMVYRKVGLVSLMAYESYYCKYDPDYSERKKKLKWMEEEYVKLLGSQRMLRHIQTGFNLSVNYFCDGNFKKALTFINEIESYPQHTEFPSMLVVLKVYKLILFYELEKYDLLSFTFRNTYRFLLKNSTYNGFEKVVMKTLRQLINANQKSEQSSILSKAYPDLLKVKKDPFEQSVFQAFNFSGWIKCKVEKKDFKYLMTVD